MPRKTNYLKFSQTKTHITFQLELQVNTINNLLDIEEEEVFTFATIKKVNEEIKDLKRLLGRRYDVKKPDQWLSLLD